MRELVLTGIIAVATAILQLAMKASSRPGSRNPLTRDDALFWSDWIIAAALAFFGSLLIASDQGKSPPVDTVVYGIITISFGLLIFPFFLRLCGAFNGSGQVTGSMWLFLANAISILVLLAAVAMGVKVYEFV